MRVSPADLKESMSTKTDAELFAILHAETEYTPEAVEAARAVFSQRNPSEQELTDFAAAVDGEREKAGAHLGWGLKVVAFFVSSAFLFIPVLLAHRHFLERGERQKAREWARAALLGFLFYCALGILIRILA